MLRRIVLYPLLLAAYPVVFLFAQNLEDQVDIGIVIPPLLVALGVTGAVLLLLWLAFRNVYKAALLTSIYVVLFFSFGHVKNVVVEPGSFVGELMLIPAWGILAAVGTIALMRAGQDLSRPTMGLNLLSAVLVVINVVPITIHEFQDARASEVVAPEVAGLPGRAEIPKGSRRDIYYLIFDRYANEETLSRLYDFDNAPFLGSLERDGFYIAHDSAANYLGTGLSLASSLNLTYLDDLTSEFGPDYGSWSPVFDRLQDFKAARYLKSIGYRYYHVGSWWQPTRADPSADVNYTFQPLSEFSNTLLRSTLFSVLGDMYDVADLFGRSRGESLRIASQFEKLAGIERDPEPTFTFAHFLLPHPPYIFDQYGNRVTREDVREQTRRERYIGQLIHTNKLIEEMVSRLLDGPDERDPIVIIQSDEGPYPAGYSPGAEDVDWFEATDSELREKMLILNAYYFPDGSYDALHGGISPVNTFRVLFNEYFGGRLRLLEDRSFVYRIYRHPYDHEEVTDRLKRRDP